MTEANFRDFNVYFWYVCLINTIGFVCTFCISLVYTYFSASCIYKVLRQRLRFEVDMGKR